MEEKTNIEYTFKSKHEFLEYILPIHRKGELHKGNFIELKNLSFQFELSIPISFHSLDQTHKIIENLFNAKTTYFVGCEFTNKVTINGARDELFFLGNCFFKQGLRINRRENNLTFKNCKINDLDVSESSFGKPNSSFGKFRIKSCEVYKTNFKNATFHALVDFYYTNFHENVIFYKTDFLNIVVLSATTFKKNILFTYTLMYDKVIMRSTNFERGFDFSLAIIKGDLAIFDINHSFKTYQSVDGLREENVYEKAVSFDGVIPTQNKLETYRLLKVEFESQKNISEHLKFKLFEKRTLKRILNNKSFTWGNAFDQITLWLNRVSNNHGTSYSRAFSFILVVGWLFFYGSLLATKTFEFSINIRDWEFNKGLGYFVQFLIPTHKFNYMGDEVLLTSCFYLFDFLGRVFVGYGIYQFIQAFRKFK